MLPHYRLPALTQYVFDRQRAEYEYSRQHYSPKPICHEYVRNPSESYLSVPPFLEDQIFESYLDQGAEEWNFIADQAAVEKKQIQVLLAQLGARYQLSQEIRASLDNREVLIGSGLLQTDPTGGGFFSDSREHSNLERRMDELSRERHMEEVGLWRDSQKVVSELFRHWSAYANLTRRDRVINNDV
jgi:hypothetical protein